MSSFDGLPPLPHLVRRVLLLSLSSPSTCREMHWVDVAQARYPVPTHTLNQRERLRPVPPSEVPAGTRSIPPRARHKSNRIASGLFWVGHPVIA
jgi:hypothetical protein